MKSIISRIQALILLRFFLRSDSNLNIKRENFVIPLGNFSVLMQIIIPVALMGAILGSGIRGGGKVIEFFLFALFNFFFFLSLVTELSDRSLKLLDGTNHLPGNNIALIDLSAILFLTVCNFLVLLILIFVCNLLNINVPILDAIISFFSTFIFGVAYCIPISLVCMMSGFFAGFHKLMRRGLFFASSVIIPVPLLPDGAIRDILLFNPLVHINETLRSSTSGIYYDFIDQSYVLEISLFLSLLIIPVTYIKQKYITEGIITLKSSTADGIDF